MNRRYEVTQDGDYYELHCYEGDFEVMGSSGYEKDLPTLHKTGKLFVGEEPEQAQSKES